MTQKIVINACYGGFSLSKEAIDLYCAETGQNPGEWDERYGYYTDFSTYDTARDDPMLVKIVEQLGPKASGSCAKLKIVEIPDGVVWEIDEYDGYERVAESHRSWS